MSFVCEECGREHVIEGEIRVDGVALHPRLIEISVEVMCKQGRLPKPSPQDERFVEPDEPGDTKSPTR